MSRWTLVLLIGAAVGLSAADETARAGSLADALNSVFNPHSTTSSKAQKPADRSAEHPTERPAEHPRHAAHLRHQHEAKPPVAAPTMPAEPPVTAAKTPSPAEPSDPGIAPAGEPNPLKPRTVQTFSFLPSAPTPVAAPPEAKEAPPADRGEVLAPPAAVILLEKPVAKPPAAPTPATDLAPAPSRPIVSGHSVIEFDLILLFVACALVSINSRSSARLSALMCPTRRGRLWLLLTNINRRSMIAGLIRRARAAAARSANRAASAQSSDASALPPDLTWDCGGVGPGGSASAPAPSSAAEHAKSANKGPELEDQLAMIVQDQIVVPLRKAS